MESKPYTIVVWGDSIAAQGSERWPERVDTYLKVVCHPGCETKVVNSAICGKPACHARNEFVDKVLKHEPDLVIIQFGFNDLRHDGSRDGLPLSTPDEFRRHIAELIHLCHTEAGADVLVFGNHKARSLLLMPTGITYDATRALYNEQARRAAAEAGARYVDMSSALMLDGVSWSSIVCDDGVHLSNLGVSLYSHVAMNEIADMIRNRE